MFCFVICFSFFVVTGTIRFGMVVHFVRLVSFFISYLSVVIIDCYFHQKAS